MHDEEFRPVLRSSSGGVDVASSLAWTVEMSMHAVKRVRRLEAAIIVSFDFVVMKKFVV